MVLAEAGMQPCSHCAQTLRSFSIQRPLVRAHASRCLLPRSVYTPQRRRQCLVQAQQQGDDPHTPQELSLVGDSVQHACDELAGPVRRQLPNTGCAAAAQAPVKPQSPVGEMLAYYYKAQPHLFKDAIEEQLRRLRDERDERDARQKAAEAEKEQDAAAATSSMDITLYK
jgi:hypothetical protein